MVPEESSGQIVPITARVRLKGGEQYPIETKARCFVLYATAAARIASNVVKLYREEVGPNEPCPVKETINLWAREERWADQADDLWRHSRGRTAHELQILATANAQLAQMRLNQILMNDDRRPVEERIVTLKAIEIANKGREKMPDLARVQPPEVELPTDELSRDEREARARAALVQRTKVRG